MNCFKSIGLIFVAALITICADGQTTNPQFDSTLAKKLGGDEYGMKMYVFVLLQTGENKTSDKQFIDSCFTGHLQNIHRLAEENMLVVAGPFGSNTKDYRGIFILNVADIKSAEKLLQTDPAIKSKLLRAELTPWYGSAALPTYVGEHAKIWINKP